MKFALPIVSLGLFFSITGCACADLASKINFQESDLPNSPLAYGYYSVMRSGSNDFEELKDGKVVKTRVGYLLRMNELLATKKFDWVLPVFSYDENHKPEIYLTNEIIIRLKNAGRGIENVDEAGMRRVLDRYLTDRLYTLRVRRFDNGFVVSLGKRETINPFKLGELLRVREDDSEVDYFQPNWWLKKDLR